MTNKEKFLNGKLFFVAHSMYPLMYSGDEQAGHLSEIKRTDREYHCNVDKVTNVGIRVYTVLAGKSISRLVRFSDMRFNDN